MSGWGLLLAASLEAASPGASSAQVPSAHVRSTLDEVLAAPEYRHLLRDRRSSPTPTPEPRRFEGDQPTPRTWKPPPPQPSVDLPRGAALTPLLRIVLYAALAGALLWLIVLAMRRFRTGSAPPARAAAPQARVIRETASAPGERDADEYLDQALAQARAGRHREAIRLLLIGAMSFLERGGFIRHRSGLTNADYLRAAGRQPPLRDSLEPIVLAFDEVYFGRRGATAERFDLCLRSYRGAFGRQ